MDLKLNLAGLGFSGFETGMQNRLSDKDLHAGTYPEAMELWFALMMMDVRFILRREYCFARNGES